MTKSSDAARRLAGPLDEEATALRPATPAVPEVRPGAEAFDLLLRLGHPDMATRYLAGRALLERVDNAPELLVRVLGQEPWTKRQEEALALLTGLGHPGLVQLATPMLASWEGPRRLAVIKALRWLVDEPALFLAALEDAYWRVRLEALFALSDLGPGVVDAAAVAALRQDPHPRVRRAAEETQRRWSRHDASRSLHYALRGSRRTGTR